MDERILKWLYDIKIAINEIDEYFLEHPKDFLKYRQNLMLKRAVERDLEIIGEAMNYSSTACLVLIAIFANREAPNLQQRLFLLKSRLKSILLFRSI